MQGRPNFVVPSFVSTFLPPTPSVAPSLLECRGQASPHCAFLCTKCTCFTAVIRGCIRLFTRPTKTSEPDCIGQIHRTKRIAIVEIVQTHSDSDPQLFFYGRLVLTSTPKKPKRQIEDIGSWLEAFSVYCLVLTSSISMEGSPALPVADSMDLSPVHRPGVAGLRSGLPRAYSCN